METTIESASDYSLAVFVGTLFAILVVIVLLGGKDELRRGIRAIFVGERTEPFRAASLKDYGPLNEEDGEGDEENEQQ